MNNIQINHCIDIEAMELMFLYQPQKFELPIEPNDVKSDPRLPWTPMELTCIGGV